MAKSLCIETKDPEKVKAAPEDPQRSVRDRAVSPPNEEPVAPPNTRQTTLKDTLASLIPDALKSQGDTDEDQPSQLRKRSSSAGYHSHIRVVTPCEYSANAGREDVVAGADEVATITRKLESLLHPLNHVDVVVNTNYENSSKVRGSTNGKLLLSKAKVSERLDKSASHATPSQAYHNQPVRLDEEGLNNPSGDLRMLHQTNKASPSAKRPIPHSEAEELTSANQQASRLACEHCRQPITQSPDEPSATPSLSSIKLQS